MLMAAEAEVAQLLIPDTVTGMSSLSATEVRTYYMYKCRGMHIYIYRGLTDGRAPGLELGLGNRDRAPFRVRVRG